jgi:hypothetical protein
MQSLQNDYYFSRPNQTIDRFLPDDVIFYRITDFNYAEQANESIGQRMLQSLADSKATVVFHLFYNGEEIEFYLGILPTSYSETSKVLQEQLHAAINVEFLGVRTKEVRSASVKAKLMSLKYTSAVMGMPKNVKAKLDRIILPMQKQPFAYSFVAQNLSKEQFIQIRDEIFAYKSLLSSEKSTQQQKSKIQTNNYTSSKNQSVLVNSSGTTSATGASEQIGTTVTIEDARKEYEYQLMNDMAAYIEQGNELGLWHTNIFLSTGSSEQLRQAEAIVKGLLSAEDKDIPPIYNGIETFEHPFFHSCVVNASNPTRKGKSENIPELYKYDCSVLLNSKLLANALLFSNKTLPGLNVYKREALEIKKTTSGIKIGNYRNVISDTKYELKIPEHLINRHVFVTGLTGSGKTSTVQKLVTEAKRNFLIIEPAKSEYRKLLNSDLNIQLYTVGDVEHPFSINPFAFSPGMNLQKHIDILKSVVNSAFGMYGPLPYIVEKALTNSYKEKGWNLITSKNERGTSEEELFPTMKDFKDNVIKLINNTNYAPEQKMNIESALVVRLESLCEGIKGSIFNTSQSFNMDELLNNNVIIELRHLGDEDDQSFVMGIILSQIYEHLEMNGHADNNLKHITVIEEAHRLLPNINTETKSADFGTMRNKSVSFFNNMLSEIRAYGEGLIVVDQIPTKISPDILKNTNVKIVHRLVAEDDKKQIASMINLEQSSVISELETGEALVHFEGLNSPAYAMIEYDKSIVNATKSTKPKDHTQRVNIQLEKEQESRVYRICNKLFYNLLFDYPVQTKKALEKARQLIVMEYPSAEPLSMLYKGLSDIIEQKYYLQNDLKMMSLFKQYVHSIMETDKNVVKIVKETFYQQYKELRERKGQIGSEDSLYQDEANFMLALLNGKGMNTIIEESFTSNNIEKNVKKLKDISMEAISSNFLIVPPGTVLFKFTETLVRMMISKLDDGAQEYFLKQLQ